MRPEARPEGYLSEARLVPRFRYNRLAISFGAFFALMKFLPPFRAPLALLVTYVAAVSAASPINAPPERSFAMTSPPGSRSTASGGSVGRVRGYTMNLQANASNS